MALEREHKYLVKDGGYRIMANERVMICQGYLCREPERTVRVRTWNNQGYITVKGLTKDDTREEYEYEIPYNDALKILKLCQGDVLEKCRYIVWYKGHRWEVDEFHGRKEGLCLAEIELSESEVTYELPPFVGENVTGNPSYYNSNL